MILFLVDATTGITDLDLSVVKLLRKSDKKVVLAVNKVDNSSLLSENQRQIYFVYCFAEVIRLKWKYYIKIPTKYIIPE